MTETYLLEHLDALARYGTLRRAAEELHITEPALSRSMKKLESEIGVALFERSKGKITLNDTGKFASECARKALEANREVRERTLAFDRSRHVISVGTCSSFPAQALLPTLQELYIDMAITTELVHEEQMIPGLQSGRYRLVIMTVPPQEDGIVVRRFLDERLFITVPKGHPLSEKKEVFFRDLKGCSILASGSAGFWLERCQKSIPAANLLIQRGASAVKELAIASSLPAFSSNRMVNHSLSSDDRIAIPIMDDDAYAVYYLVCCKSETEQFPDLLKRLDYKHQ